MQDIDTKLLRTFISVAKTRSMTISARQTGQTQGAVSQQIKRLEALLGRKLFLRSERSLRLTASGDQLVHLAGDALAACDTIFKQFRPTSAARTVRFGIPYDLVSAYLGPMLDRFSAAFPEIDVELHCDASSVLKQQVTAGELDLALIEEPAQMAQGDILRVEPLVWIGRTGGCAHQKRPLPLSLVAETCAFRSSVQEALEDKKLPWRTVFENGDLNATMATVRSDMSITAGLKSLVPPDLALLPASDLLPKLPAFAICLYPVEIELDKEARELSVTIQKILSPVIDGQRIAR